LADAAVVGVASVEVAVAGPDRIVYVGFAFVGAGVGGGRSFVNYSEVELIK